MIVGEPTLMGGDFGDEDERLITRLENTQYDAAASAGVPPSSSSHMHPGYPGCSVDSSTTGLMTSPMGGGGVMGGPSLNSNPPVGSSLPPPRGAAGPYSSVPNEPMYTTGSIPPICHPSASYPLMPNQPTPSGPNRGGQPGGNAGPIPPQQHVLPTGKLSRSTTPRGELDYCIVLVYLQVETDSSNTIPSSRAYLVRVKPLVTFNFMGNGHNPTTR